MNPPLQTLKLQPRRTLMIIASLLKIGQFMEIDLLTFFGIWARELAVLQLKKKKYNMNTFSRSELYQRF